MFWSGVVVLDLVIGVCGLLSLGPTAPATVLLQFPFREVCFVHLVS